MNYTYIKIYKSNLSGKIKGTECNMSDNNGSQLAMEPTRWLYVTLYDITTHSITQNVAWIKVVVYSLIWFYVRMTGVCTT